MSNGRYLVINQYTKNEPLFHKGFGHIWVGKPLWNDGLFVVKNPIINTYKNLYNPYMSLVFFLVFAIFSYIFLYLFRRSYRALI